MYLLNVKNSLEENIRRGSGNNEVISDSVVQSTEEPADEPMFELPSIPSLPSLPTIPVMDVETVIESKGRRGSKTEPKRRRGGPFDGPYDFQVPTLPKPDKKEIPTRTNWYKKGWDLFFYVDRTLKNPAKPELIPNRPPPGFRWVPI